MAGGKLESPCNFTWDSENLEAKNDGVMLYLTFVVPSSAKAGDTFVLDGSYRKGDIYDNNMQDIENLSEIIDGKITVI